jgi:ATPase subunit of ABC transporter with duplicated ATPase domains
MLEMERGRGTPYKGNYSTYLDEKAKRLADQDRQDAARKRLIARELEWIRKTPKARTAKSKARLKNFEKMYDEVETREDDAVTITIPPGEKLGQLVLQVEHLHKSFGSRKVINDLSFEIPPAAILGVIGPNGTGKTTLLKIISKQVEPDAGKVRLGPTVTPCFVDQERATLDPEKTVWQEISEGQDELKLGSKTMNSRAYVAKFNFKSQDQQQLVGTLSGGQRNRVQLAKMLRRGGNLLLVDEPTNDLDLGTIQVLEDALEAFPGSAIVVSHDRFFLDKIATHILAFQPDGKWRFWEGNYATYRERLEEEREEAGLGPATKGVHRRLA